LRRTLFNCGRQAVAAFQKHLENPGNVLANRNKGITFKTEIVHAVPFSKEFFQFKSIGF
jgi:hypothetical protein